MRESNEKLDEIMKSVVALVPVNTSSKDVDMKYSCLDEGTVKEITSSLRALLEVRIRWTYGAPYYETEFKKWLPTSYFRTSTPWTSWYTK